MKFLTRYGNNLKERFLFTLFSKYYPSININRGKSDTMKYLNVAEKNDAAKNIALHLSRGTSRRREGLSRFNKIYEFDGEVNGQKCQMVMTSVSGHLLALEFVGAYKGWQSCDPLTLFTAPVFKYCPKDYENIKKTLEREIRSCQGLIIWTDCDREGENIGFEIIEVCTAVKNNLRIYRAKFSEITAVSVRRALQTLEQPDKNVSDAVDVRQELDLRIGAAFTRFQTLRLQKVFPSKLADSLVSYGSCQFPTLGFVVERYRAVENFIAEPFWKIKVNHTMNNLSVDFSWERVRLFDQVACQVLHDICMESPQAKVCDVKTKPKSKWRPLPLDTVELEKLASRKLKINAKETMRLAERLYTQGFISYPRTETNEYPKEMNLGQLVGLQTGDPQWGPFAQGILDSGGPTPRQGNKSDKAHPPIHPTKYANSLSGNEQRLYEFIVRSFLACCSKDAQGQETTATIDVAGERFAASGLMITARNYLDVYPYDKWSSKEIHVYQAGQTFNPTSIDLVDGSTSPPSLLTEADLIALMEKHGIGTDATHAEHIETIKKRCYVDVVDTRFVPGLLGMGLVEGYDALRLRLARPDLRARLEADLKDISLGNKMPQVVLAEQIEIYKSVYQTVTAEPTKIDTALAARFNERPNEYTPVTNATQNLPSVLKCPKCGADMVVRQKKNNADELYISCMSFPSCKNAVWLPPLVKTLGVATDACPTCGPNYKRVTFEWRNNSISHMFPPPYTSCIGGCDRTLLEYLRINLSSVRNTPESRTQVDNRPRDTSNSTNVTRDVLPRQNPIPNPPRQFVPPVVVNRDQNPTNNSRMPPPRNMPVPAQDDTNVMCKCNSAAIQLTVRKQNENFGKKFYKCAQGKDNGGCDFFLWSPENSDVPPAQTAQSSSWGAGSDAPSSSRSSQRPSSSTSGYNSDSVTGNDDDVQCNCGLPAKRVIAQKEGPNKGRAFYGCSKDFSSRCNFFQWADTGPQPTTEWNSENFRVRDRGRDGRGAGGRGRGGRGGPRGGSGPRKCTLCRQEGHTRNRCPNVDSNI